MGEYIKQLGTGPALGICQMEPTTHDDIWNNWLLYRSELADKVIHLCRKPVAEEMVWNLKYAVAMCRLHYYRKPGAIPTNLHGIAAYWKEHYNTPLGKGTEAEFIYNFGKLALRLD